MNWVLQRYVTWHAKRVERALLSPEVAQRTTFRRLQRTLRGSQVSHASGFADIDSLDGCRHLPIADSEGLHPLLQRTFSQGDSARRIFGRSRLLAFGRTSGTSASPKDIPINRAYLASMDRTLRRMVASYLYFTQAWSSFLSGRHIILAGRPIIERSPTGLPIADISGLIPTRTLPILRWLYLPHYRDLWLRDWSERRERALELGRTRNVTTISGIPALMDDFVQRAREGTGDPFLDRIWPNLRFYIFGAVAIPEHEREELRRRWFRRGAEHEFYFIETYFATEGCLAHSFDPREEGLALNLHEVLFTFKEDASDDTSMLPHELEVSRRYLLYITTPGGLINYAMGDRIEVVSVKPLLIRVVGRDEDEVSLTGEKVTLEQLRLAVADLDLGEVEFVVWPDDSPGRRHLAWGLSDLHRRALGDRAARRLDRSLSRYNFQYNEALNLERVIGPATVTFIPEAVFARYRRKDLGIGQFKAKRIFGSRAEFEAAFAWVADS